MMPTCPPITQKHNPTKNGTLSVDILAQSPPPWIFNSWSQSPMRCRTGNKTLLRRHNDILYQIIGADGLQLHREPGKYREPVAAKSSVNVLEASDKQEKQLRDVAGSREPRTAAGGAFPAIHGHFEFLYQISCRLYQISSR